MKTIINSTLLSKIKLGKKQYDIWDAKLTGFILRVNPNGNLVYRCEYARGKRITIGNARILTPIQARDRAKEILADAVKGIDPRNIKKIRKQEELTLKKFIEDEYSPWVIAHRKSGTDTIARIKRCFFSDYENMPILHFTIMELEKWRTEKIGQGCKATTVNRDIIALRAAFSKAVEWGSIDIHPLAKLKLFKTDTSAKIRYLNRILSKLTLL